MFVDRVYINRAYFETLRASGRRPSDFARISSSMAGRFGKLLDEACGLKASIFLHKTLIFSAQNLTLEIAKLHLEDDATTLCLFEKAIWINNNCAALNYDYLKAGNNTVSYKYVLDLGKLLPEYLKTNDLHKKAYDFYKNADHIGSLDLLRELGTAERVYESPIMSFIGSCISWTRSDINRLAESWFGDLINGPLKSNVRLKFRRLPVTKLEELAGKIDDNHLATDGRTLLLMRTSLRTTIAVSKGNPDKIFDLTLGLLTPDSLKELKIPEKEIDDIIDILDHEIITKFLSGTGALIWTGKKD
jgi:hypothetical protein